MTMWQFIGWLERLKYVPGSIIYRIRKGFWQREAWDVASAIARFALPRLKEMRKDLHVYPPELTEEEWDNVLDEIIWAFAEHDNLGSDKVQLDRFDRALDLFGKYFWDLCD